MTDTDRVMVVIEDMAREALHVADELVAEARAAQEPIDPGGLWSASLKTVFHIGVAVGQSDAGERILAALAVVNPEDMSDGVAEFRKTLDGSGGGSSMKPNSYGPEHVARRGRP